MTADELVAKNLEARGGEAKLRAIKSIHRVGKVRTGGGAEAKIESWAVSPEKFRSEFSLQGMTAVSAWDGTAGVGGLPVPRPEGAAEARPRRRQGHDRAGRHRRPARRLPREGHAIEYLGTEDIDGTEAHKLRVTLKNGDTQLRFLDPDAFLEIRIVSQRMVRGQEAVQSVDLGEYEKVDGIYFPFELGRNQLETIELNPAIDPAIFAMPGGAR